MPPTPITIITGAARGIGRAIAIDLREAGHEIVLVSRSQPDLEETARVAGGGVVMPADVTQAGEVEAAVAQTVRRFGRVDVVVNNAGWAPVISARDMTPPQWRAVIETNLSAAFYFAHAVWPTFEKQQRGVIVNISSLAARDPLPGFAAYGAAKAGLQLLGLTLAREGQPIGVRVHTVAPGAVETAMFRGIMTPQQWPAEKTLDPADVARVVRQCINGDLRHTSGEVIYVHKTI